MPNENAIRPLEHLDLKDYPNLSTEMKQYWHGEPPSNFFKQATEVVLKPGSVLFVPRGWWHATCSDMDTLAVNITYSVPTKLEVILDALKKKLSKRPTCVNIYPVGMYIIQRKLVRLLFVL